VSGEVGRSSGMDDPSLSEQELEVVRDEVRQVVAYVKARDKEGHTPEEMMRLLGERQKRTARRLTPAQFYSFCRLVQDNLPPPSTASE
jgi:hypothetical protein